MHLWELILVLLLVGAAWIILSAVLAPPHVPSSRSLPEVGGPSLVGDLLRGGREFLDRAKERAPAFQHSLGLLGATYAVPWLVERCRQCNPLLSGGQLSQLHLMLGNAVTECLRRDGQPLARVVRPIIALAVPDGELAYDLLMAFAGAATDPHPKKAPPLSPLMRQDGDVSATLCHECGCSPGAVKRIGDAEVQAALLDALRARPPPTCPITLEELVVDGLIDRDVAIIVQRPGGSNNLHVFLYRRSALERWFADRPAAPTNPLTRQTLNTNRDYIPLS